MESRTRRVEAARGDRSLDLLIEEAELVNVYTREIYPVDIGVSGGYIAHVGPPGWLGKELPEPEERFSAKGKFAVPGLVDTHVHIESSMMSPAEFAAAVLVRGTTTVVIDPHEIANVMGVAGVRYMLDATAELPLRVYVQVPSCVPAVPDLETAGAAFGAEEVAEMLTWERVIGLAEVMDYVGVVQQADRMRTILGAALAYGTVISGHCPGLRGPELAAYMMGGPLSDHEGRDSDELLEKLREGMVIEGRVSSFDESMSVLGKIVQRIGTVPPNLVLCTDDIFPEDLLRNGHMDNVVRNAIAAGFPPIDAVRAGTLHGAQRHRLHDLGAIAPGKRADILLVRDLASFEPEEVLVNGQMVAKEGHLLVSLPRLRSDVEQTNTVHLPRLPQQEDFVLRARPGRRRESCRVMAIGPSHPRTLEITEFPVRDGIVDISARDDICLASIMERHGQTGGRSLTLVKGLKLNRGAVASTVAHDSHNLLVVGRDAEDMAVAARELIACGGGVCCVREGQVGNLLPLPIAGLMSSKPLAEMVVLMHQLSQALRDMGMDFRQPFGPVISLALPVIPFYGITDKGLVDTENQVVLSIWADEG